MRAQILPAAWSVAAAAAWVLLASRSPNLTYHFAPLVAAGAWPIAGSRARWAVASGAIAVATAVGLRVSSSLEGPDLIGGHAAFAEAVLFALVGAGGGAIWAVRRSHRTTSAG